MMAADAVFYFDLASPACYLAAERVMHAIAPPLEWQPVLARDADAVRDGSARLALERRADALGLQPLRWPEDFPFDSGRAMLAATYAKEIGRGAAFALAAFRQAFAGGHSLGNDDYVLIAAAACEMHPAAVLRAIERRGIRDLLARASSDAARAGVAALPAVRRGEQVLAGEGLLAELGEPYPGERPGERVDGAGAREPAPAEALTS
jgi:2-hydroxychromene-2-carboxylate isomerase